MDKITQILRENPAPLPPEVAIPAIKAHLTMALRLSKGLGEGSLSSQIHEVLAAAELLKAEAPKVGSAKNA